MAEEMKTELKTLADGLNDLNRTVIADIAYRRGLEVPTRLKQVEDNLEKKASWMGLYLAIGLLCAVVGCAFIVANGVTH